MSISMSRSARLTLEIDVVSVSPSESSKDENEVVSELIEQVLCVDDELVDSESDSMAMSCCDCCSFRGGDRR